MDGLHDKREPMSPNARRAILDGILREGASWETHLAEYIARVAKGGNKKYAKARMGSKAAKHAERMDAGGDDLDEESTTMYRALSARLLYLSMDRPEVAYAAKELCRHFAHPTKLGVEGLKRAVRFLVGLPRLVWHFPFTNVDDVLKVYVDTDLGGCQHNRRSTSGGIALRGTHAIKHRSLTQTTIALLFRGSRTWWDMPRRFEILSDATAAMGICRRRGLGKLRHLHVADLWVEDRLRRGDFQLTKVLGSDNRADLLTIHVSRDIMLRHMETIGIRAEVGRAKSAPTLQHS